MRNIIYIISFLLFAFSCQTSSQNNESSKESSLIENTDSLNIKSKQELKYFADSTDIAIYDKLIAFAKQKQLATKPISEIEMEIAQQLFGTPYVGQTLENDSIERLVINLHELDCTTFVENVLVISWCIKNNSTSFNDYCNMLKRLRYRDGIIDQYPSRLHYTTDWLIDNQKKGIIKIVSEDFGTADFDTKVNFMSTHPKSYKQLSNTGYIDLVKQQEIRISSSKLKFVQKEKINEVAKMIKDGDIIGISTTIAGLDFSHMALAAWHNNQLHFIHASSAKKKVVLSDKTLYEYLATKKNNDGIVVGRIVIDN